MSCRPTGTGSAGGRRPPAWPPSRRARPSGSGAAWAIPAALSGCTRRPGILTERHDGQVPPSYEALLALPGIGRYTAAAVASFAFKQRYPVLDTNVRRVMSRLVSGAEFPGRTPSAAEWRLAESLLPAEPQIAARWSVGVMELGALVCTAARPRCAACPLARDCSWLRAGRPAAAMRPVGQRYEGTDRQCRGRLLAVLRDAEGDG